MTPMPAAGGEDRGEVLFREEQRFRQWWIYGVVLAASGFSWYSAVRYFFAGRPPDEKPEPGWLVFPVWLLAGIGPPALFLSARLVVEVRQDGLRYRFYPFHLRSHLIGAEEIAEAEARTYRPILEYGGWGIRYGRRGKAYNVSGNRGVEIRLRDGRRVLFGSLRPEELARALKRIRPT